LFLDVNSLLYKKPSSKKTKTRSMVEGLGAAPERRDRAFEEAHDGDGSEYDCTEATTQCDEFSAASAGLSASLSELSVHEVDDEEVDSVDLEERKDGRSRTLEHRYSSDSASDDDDDDSEVFPPSPQPIVSSEFLPSAGTSLRGRSSLRRSSINSDIFAHISMKRGCWKVLPVPDVPSIRSRSLSALGDEPNAPTAAATATAWGRRRTVSFGDVHMRSYDQTLGDNPSVSYGPPISLDWKFLELPSLSLEQYEATKKPPRKPRDMVLNYYNRKHLLAWKFGFSEAEIKQASRDADRCKRERAVTRALLPTRKLEDLFESAKRKAARRVVGNPASSSSSSSSRTSPRKQPRGLSPVPDSTRVLSVSIDHLERSDDALSIDC
jgi:hypothetical protein